VLTPLNQATWLKDTISTNPSRLSGGGGSLPLVELPTVSFSTVSLGPLTAAAPHPSPGVPSHYGSRKPRVTSEGVGVRFINFLRDIPSWIT